MQPIPHMGPDDDSPVTSSSNEDPQPSRLQDAARAFSPPIERQNDRRWEPEEEDPQGSMTKALRARLNEVIHKEKRRLLGDTASSSSFERKDSRQSSW